MHHRVDVRGFGVALLVSLGLAPAACGGETAGVSGVDGGGGTGGGGAAPACANPVEEPPGSGWIRCASGRIHRAVVATCASSLPRPGVTCEDGTDAGAGACSTDSDCDAQPLGYCARGDFGSPSCQCNYGCRTDAECGPGNVCRCADPVGHCFPANCASDTECGAGQLCADHDRSRGCDLLELTCTKPADDCFADADCDGGMCAVGDSGARECVPWGCAIGRPFLVGGEPRLAGVEPRADWLLALEEGHEELDPAFAAELRERWLDVARMEHAAVAAFARFTLQLLALGAPPELVEESHRAGLDEVRHARVAFSLASRHGARAVGPGPLAIDHALEEVDARSLAKLLFHEGCVGETTATLEALEAADHARDPATRSALEGIARDEREHALLAWRTVAWLASVEPRVLGDLERELESRLAYRPEPTTARPELLAHGIVDGPTREALRAQSLREVIAPAVAALVARGRPRPMAVAVA